MLKFIESKSINNPMLQFIVNLLYLGMKSGNGIWAQSNGTEQAVKDLLSAVSDSFIKTANNILANVSIEINIRHRRLEEGIYREIDVKEYQDIIDVLRGGELYLEDFSKNCKRHFERLTDEFPVYENLSVLTCC